jgi:uncharacterized membrane protein YhiD involved in acid resistance
MFNEFTSISPFPITLADILVNLLIALICGFIISLVYRYVYKGPSYSVTFVNSLILLTLITSVVILVIGNNLARAFGLVGAMSIIRFRTAIRDTQDIVFIFFSLSIGMGCGVGLHFIAIISTLLIGVVIIILSKTNYAHPRRRHYLLQLTYNASLTNEAGLTSMLNRYCKNVKLVHLKNLVTSDEIEAYYHIMLKDNNKSSEFVQSLKEIDELNYINLYFDEEDVTSNQI